MGPKQWQPVTTGNASEKRFTWDRDERGGGDDGSCVMCSCTTILALSLSHLIGGQHRMLWMGLKRPGSCCGFVTIPLYDLR